MKNNTTKRLLALLLTLAMLLPNFVGAFEVRADEYTTGTATVYDLYDLTGETSKTIDGRIATGTWDQTIGTVAEEHKGNVAFTAKMTVGSEYEHIFIGLGMTGANASNTTDGYTFEIQAKAGEADAVVYHKKDASWQASSQNLSFDFNGTYVLELGVVDLYQNGALVGKRAYLKANGEEVCHWDDTNAVTTENLSTTVGIYNEQNNITLETTYEKAYGTPTVYDIYDLTGSMTNTLKGTDETWDGQIHANINEAHKENFAFKTKLTMETQNVRLSLAAMSDVTQAQVWDPPGYAVYLYGAENKIEIRRNNGALQSATVDSLAGTYTFEAGVVDLMFGGKVTGKYLYVKINDEVVCEYEDTSGYLTGDALGTKIIDFHYGASIQMDTTYETTYGEVNVYDIYDLTGVASTSVAAWTPTKLGTLADADKEQAAIKFNMNITDVKHRYRFAVGNTNDGNEWDPYGYSVEIAVQLDGSNYVKFMRNQSQLAIWNDVSGVIGEYDYEFGYRTITFGSNVIGKQVYLSVDGTDLYTYEDTSGYLTGDALGTTVSFNQIDDAGAVTLNSTYENEYGTPEDYDIYYLTGSLTNTFYGTDTDWNREINGHISEAHKENFVFRTKLTADLSNASTKQIRLGLTSKDTDEYDPSGYAVYLDWSDNSVKILRNQEQKAIATVTSLSGTYELEAGVVDITFAGQRIGKYLYVKMDGVVVCACEDTSGYLTGDTLGTRVYNFHYGPAIQMDSTYDVAPDPKPTEPATEAPTEAPTTTEEPTTEEPTEPPTEAPTSYADVNVYDIYDLTDAVSYTVSGTENGVWYGTVIGEVNSADKENISLKANVTMDTTAIRSGQTVLLNFSLSASYALLDDGTKNYFDCSGYAMQVYTEGGSWYYALKKNNSEVAKSGAVTADVINTTQLLELGYRSIMQNGVIVGKRVFLNKDGVELLSYEDTSGFLTGDDLSIEVAAGGYCKTVQLTTAYETTYGEINAYDIFDLTGKQENVYYGTSGSTVGGDDEWSGTTIGNVADADKENFGFKANVTIPAGIEIRWSFGALDSANAVDYAGYALMIKDSSVTFYRNKENLTSFSADMTGTYVLEFSIQDVKLNGNIVSKRLTLKRDGAVIGTYDDASTGKLTGDNLGTKIAIMHYGTSITMTSAERFFVKGYNLSINQSTIMNLWMDNEVIGDSAATVHYAVMDGEKIYNEASYKLSDLPVDSNGPKISVPLASGQMNDPVVVTVTLSDGSTIEKSYTVAGYANFVLNGGYSAEVQATVRDMLHYGAAAQAYFGYNTENPANDGIADNPNETITSAYQTSLTGTVDGISVYGSTLLCVETITLRHYLNVTGSIDEYNITFNGNTVTPVKCNASGANYYVQLTGIMPQNLDQVCILQITRGGQTITYNYSPMSYVLRMKDKAAIADLMQELYDYFVSAKQLTVSTTVDTATVLDLYQLTGETSLTVPANTTTQIGLLVGAEDGFVKKELTSNVAVRFKYTGTEGSRFLLGANGPEISSETGGLFMSVPDNNSFGIAYIQDTGIWQKDSAGNDLFSWQSCLGRDQTSYIELGCVKVYTNGVYTHDRYYVRAAATLAELETMAKAGSYSTYYDTTMKDNMGNRLLVRSRMTSGGDVLATTWTADEITAYEAGLASTAQSLTSSHYDALAQKYQSTVSDAHTAASVATAKKPDTTIATNGDELILWAESGVSKIVQDDDGKAATQANSKSTLSISMAKNEDEGAQLMLFGKKDVESYEVFVTDLVSGSNKITADNIRLYQLKYLTVDNKYDDVYDSDDWWDTDDNKRDTYETPSQYADGKKLPDAMLPFAKAVEYGENYLISGNNQAIYVDVTADKTVAAGTYTGTVVVKTEAQVYTLPISVTVADVTLPDNSTLGTYAPYLDRQNFSSGELDGSDKMASLYISTLQQFNMSSMIPTSDGVMNLEKFLVNVRDSYDSLTNYALPVDTYDSFYTYTDIDDTEQTAVYCNYALLKEYVVELAKLSIADGKNYLDKAFFYPSDHADESMTEEDFTLTKNTYKAFCQMLDDAHAELTQLYSGTAKYTEEIQMSVKELRFLMTIPGDDSNGRSLDVGAIYEDVLKVCDRANVIVCTTNEVLARTTYYGSSVADAMESNYADELWTYLCLKPWYPHSNYAFDTPVVGLRTLGWTCYQKNVDTLMTWKSVGYLYDSVGQSLDRWTTSLSTEITNLTPGDGNVFYPGAKYGIDGPCPSLRAVAWRDAVDDYELMNQVEENGGSADSLNSLYSLITQTVDESISVSEETAGIWGSLVTRNIETSVPIDDDVKFAIVREALLNMAASNTSEHATIISNATAAVNAVTAASGTTSSVSTSLTESTTSISSNIYNSDGFYQLAGFETYEETIQNKLTGHAQYALVAFDGNDNSSNSLQVTVQPDQEGGTVWIPTSSKYFSATTDFSTATKITFKVYNAQQEDSSVRFYVNTYDRAGNAGVPAWDDPEHPEYDVGTYYKGDNDIWHDDLESNTSLLINLVPGWNTVTINASDISVDLSTVGAFIIAFDSGAGFNSAQVFYLDDVRVYMNQVS